MIRITKSGEVSMHYFSNDVSRSGVTTKVIHDHEPDLV